ncbi:uncharacterized protein LOC126360013 [Schistocerca gregaria]|uniref:uncharacterized protein LOC126360013 n=1 Tax=Schistocerca gregaria TaxID=7010 RepID=UPI00211EAC5C|nr:uncharacterized protein LOC126360013 [Schistocerca gregaria]
MRILLCVDIYFDSIVFIAMGSIDKAVITGFICRLCSKMNRFVIHIYGEEGARLRLAEKINAYLPITISANDPLPKTVCVPCIQRLEIHHELMEQFTWARKRLAESDDGKKRTRVKPRTLSRECVLVLTREAAHQDTPPVGDTAAQ